MGNDIILNNMIKCLIFYVAKDANNEDLSRVHKDHAGENMAIVRHIVWNMLNKAKGGFKGVGLKALRKKAGWENNTLSYILKQSLTLDYSPNCSLGSCSIESALAQLAGKIPALI